MKLLAIRSLQCPDHATNLPPTVLNVLWMLGKRCNFDCSYCSPHAHDATSPFINVQQCINFIHKTNQWALGEQKKIKWSFTGGEPFIDPGFVDLIECINALATTEQINVVTNGSLPLDTYLARAPLFAGITFSIHLERPQLEVSQLVKKIISLQNSGLTMITVNLMALPGRLTQIKEIQSQLEKHNVPVSVRRITPMKIDDRYLPFIVTGSTRKSIRLLDINTQSRTKNQWKTFNDISRKSSMEIYYNREEEEYFKQTAKTKIWQNIGLWTDCEYTETNSNHLIANNTNAFYGWTCFAGVDHIMIDFDGQIYRAHCHNNGSIGYIDQTVGFTTEPTICQRLWCTCSSDIAIRKSLPENLNLISGQT